MYPNDILVKKQDTCSMSENLKLNMKNHEYVEMMIILIYETVLFTDVLDSIVQPSPVQPASSAQSADLSITTFVLLDEIGRKN